MFRSLLALLCVLSLLGTGAVAAVHPVLALAPSGVEAATGQVDHGTHGGAGPSCCDATGATMGAACLFDLVTDTPPSFIRAAVSGGAVAIGTGRLPSGAAPPPPLGPPKG
jgi:hypothetical protein